MKPILNIITITKDDLDGVAATISSTRMFRSLPGVRQIIVDSSADTVSARLRDLVSVEQNMEYIWQEPSGISAAFNLGIKAATDAEWNWFLNGRDEVHPDLDASLLLQLLGLTQADVMIFQIEYMGSQLPPRRRPPLWALWPPLYPNWVPHPGTFIRSALFDQYGVFDPDYKIAMDGDLWIRLFNKDVSVDMLSIPIVLYDIKGISAVNHALTDREAKRIFRRYMGRFIRQWLSRGMHLFKFYIGVRYNVITRILNKIRSKVTSREKSMVFKNSSQYWDDRYKVGGTSGAGSYGRLARFKAEVLNEFVIENDIKSVVEFGCGDGAQLELANYPEYVGFDVSPQAVAICRKKFAGHSTYQFFETNVRLDQEGSFDLALSLDVIYHLIEDDVFDAYMRRLFAASRNYVIIYSNNVDMKFDASHVRGRNFSTWCDEYAKGWGFNKVIENRYPYDPAQPNDTSHSEFYIYKRVA